MFTRLVSRDRAAVVVQHSKTVFFVGCGTVWKWSNNQIESQDPASAAFATAVIASHCSTGSSILTRSIRQPCGTKIPKRVMCVSLVHRDKYPPPMSSASGASPSHRDPRREDGTDGTADLCQPAREGPGAGDRVLHRAGFRVQPAGWGRDQRAHGHQRGRVR